MQQHLAVVIAAGLALVVGIFLAASYTELPAAQYGTLSGRVTIGPFCPVQQAGQQCSAPNGTYSSRELVLSGAYGDIVFVGLSPDGTFSANVPAGTYAVSLTDCTFVGCGGMHANVSVRGNSTSALNISIDTGIR